MILDPWNENIRTLTLYSKWCLCVSFYGPLESLQLGHGPLKVSSIHWESVIPRIIWVGLCEGGHWREWKSANTTTNHVRSLNHVWGREATKHSLYSSTVPISQVASIVIHPASFSLPHTHALLCTSGFTVPGCHHPGGGGGINQIIEVSKHVGHDYKQAEVLIEFKDQFNVHTHTPISSSDWQWLCEYSHPW